MSRKNLYERVSKSLGDIGIEFPSTPSPDATESGFRCESGIFPRDKILSILSNLFNQDGRDCLPRDISGDYEDFLSITEGNLFIFIRPTITHSVGLNLITDIDTLNEAYLVVNGYMPKIVWEFDETEISALIREVIAKEIKIKHINAEMASIYKHLGTFESFPEEETKQERLLIALQGSSKHLMGQVARAIDTISGYFSRNPIKDCEVIAIAIDPKNRQPCVVVMAKINKKYYEIPKGICNNLILKHLTGEFPITTKAQLAFKIAGKISAIRKILNCNLYF